MPLAVALGFGLAAWVDAAGAPRRRRRRASCWERDPDEAVDIAPLLEGKLAELVVFSPDDLRAQGLRDAGELAAARPERYWIHLDVDVLDERVMPATDYLMPGGSSGRSWPSCSPRSALRRPPSG